MSALDTMSPADVGERLRIARDNADITQKDAADKINIARTTLVAIEKGQRRIRIDELQQLAKLYGTSVNALLRREAVHVDLVPRFRKPSLGSPLTASMLPPTGQSKLCLVLPKQR